MQQIAALEVHAHHLSFAHAPDLAFRGKRVHRLEAHAVKAYRLLEILVVELASGIDFRSHLLHFAERDSASVVAHRNLPLVSDGDVDSLSHAHVELVDGVVEHLLDKHIYAVVGMRAVAELSYVHTRSAADMLVPRKLLDGVVVIRVCRCVRPGSAGLHVARHASRLRFSKNLVRTERAFGISTEKFRF